ncbi:hypothetical protein QCM80_30160 [Bradyrhizobium sp. SSUT112]|uniref:hypothetical protein n=1 Tax=Bradyrhizobium sp. SSUT112 TaxID=3040604 RepID=UPI00244A8607|nr:hypothetical protein [Bradyrhizobium sp. SSUT112]MDH2354900.1 hypothetical protein [Bradyrhizobium sp. SSUT112]
MSARAIAYVEDFVDRNVHAEGYEPEGNTSESEALATRCLAAAKADGIPEAEMKAAFENLQEYMAAAIEEANDNEVARLAAKD